MIGCWERERFGFVTNNSIEVCNNVRARDMNTATAARCQKGAANAAPRLSPLLKPVTHDVCGVTPHLRSNVQGAPRQSSIVCCNDCYFVRDFCIIPGARFSPCRRVFC